MTRQQEKDLAWLQVCFDLSELSTCARRATGCVMVDKNNHVLSASWNGVPKGMPHCTDSPCGGVHLPSGTGLNTCEAIHAEENALQLCPDISRIETIYCTTSPCLDRCLRKLINTGASRIVFANQYPDPQQLGKMKWESSREGRKWVNQIMYDRMWLLNTQENALPAGFYYARQKDKPWHKYTLFLDGKTFDTGDFTVYQLIRKPTYDRRIPI